MNTHVKVEGNLEQVGQFQMSIQGFHAVRRKHPSEKKKRQILTSALGESKIRTHIPISERDPDWQPKRKISKRTTVRPKVDGVE